MTSWKKRIYQTQDGLRLVADHGGNEKAPAVILLHGGGQTRHSWSRAAERLVEEGLQVISFDARGHGESDWSADGAYQLTDRAADLALITSELKTPYFLVGASLGGATSIVSIHQGLRPAGLVLVDIVPQPDPRGISRIIAFMQGYPDGFANLDEAAAAVAAYNPQRKVAKDNQGLMKNLRIRSDGRLRWHWDPLIVADHPGTLHHIVQEAAKTLEQLPDLPVLLVRGMASDVVSDESIEAFRQGLPRLELLDVEGAGHMVAGDRNDVFNDGIIAFVQKRLALSEAL